MAGNVVVKTRTSSSLRNKLAQLAKRNRRSIAEELRIAIENHVEAPAGKDGGQ